MSFPINLNHPQQSLKPTNKAKQHYLNYESKLQTDHLITQKENVSFSKWLNWELKFR